jgi:hypothetical protein
MVGGGERGAYVEGGDCSLETTEELRLEAAESAAGGRANESIAARLCGWISDEGAGVGKGERLDMAIYGPDCS